MNRKTLLIAGGALVVTAFLLGFVPQYLKATDLDNQLGAVRQQFNSQVEKSQNGRSQSTAVQISG